MRNQPHRRPTQNNPALRASIRRTYVFLIVAVVGLAGTLLLLRAAQDAALRRREVRVSLDVPYRTVDNQTLGMDVYQPLPSAGKGHFPVVLLLHGGGWTAGNKHELRAYAYGLAQQGIVAASANYRLVSRDGTRNQWPAQIEDVRAAVAFLRQPEQTARFHGFPGGKIGVMGHSSGAHLAALLGVQNPKKDGIGAVIDFAGPVDLTDSTHPPLTPFEMPLLPRLFGETQKQAPRVYRDASPACLVQKDAAVPFLIFHGGDDPVVPLYQARRMETALREKHISVVLNIMPGEGHLFGRPENVTRWINESARFFKTKLP